MSKDLSQTALRIRYPAGRYNDGRTWPALDELRLMSLLSADLPALFSYVAREEAVPHPERRRPRQETQAAALLNAVQSQNPWKDQWISFWRDHFSVNGYEGGVEAFIPHWEREVIQRHAFGNFRQFLEATTTHPCMLFYLNNRSSKAGNANENYARELFELHTLGRGAYLNDLYAEWRSVPGAAQAKPQGYIDQDVYEAARAFTGWTVEDGSGIGGGQSLPKTGRFKYVEAWHDNYQKRVLANEFNPYSGSMKDGQRVLDLCASHPATASHVMTKLVKRMISDDPTKALVDSTIKLFIQHQQTPNQLALIYQHLAKEALKIPASQRQKTRNPMRLVAVFAQAVRLPFDLSEANIMGAVEAAGPAIYSWVSPDGPPDGMSALLSAGYLRQRISLVQGLAENWWSTGDWNPYDGLSRSASYAQLMAHWDVALLGEPRPDLWQAILAAQGINPTDTVLNVREARKMIGYLAWSPSFQSEAIKPDTNLPA